MLKIARGHESEFVIASEAGVKSRACGAWPEAVASAYWAVRYSRAPCVTRPDRSEAFSDASAVVMASPVASSTDEMRSRSRFAALCASSPDWATISFEQALMPSAEAMSRAAAAAARVRRFITSFLTVLEPAGHDRGPASGRRRVIVGSRRGRGRGGACSSVAAGARHRDQARVEFLAVDDDDLFAVVAGLAQSAARRAACGLRGYRTGR